MQIIELDKKSSVLNHFLREIRDQDVQKDAMRFRRNLERIGEILAYELSKDLSYSSEAVTTVLGETECNLISDKLVLATILRAGLPLHQGMLNYFDGAESAFVSAYRRYHKGGEFEIEVEYISSPKIEDKILVIADPMIATGASIEKVYKGILSKGIPKEIHIVAAISSAQGIAFLKSRLPATTKLWTASIDGELTAQAFIVPGLGDAGDLAYGKKK